MSQKTLKMPGYKGTAYPEQQPDNPDLVFHNELLTRIIFGLWNTKKAELAEKGWPPMPVHQREIYREYADRMQRHKDLDYDLDLHGEDRYWPDYAVVHDHNWIERRVNYLATPALGPKKDGVLMIVNPTAGKYEPNPELFRDENHDLEV